MSSHRVIGNRLRPTDALREPTFIRIEGCHMEGAPPGSACACPCACMSVYEITSDRLEWERREAAANAVADLFAELRTADLSHPSLIRQWFRDREAQMRREA